MMKLIIQKEFADEIALLSAMTDSKAREQKAEQLLYEFRFQLEKLYVERSADEDLYRRLKYLEEDLKSMYGRLPEEGLYIRALLDRFLLMLGVELEAIYIRKLFAEPGSPENSPSPSSLRWTASKSHLVELVYALYVSGWINDGKIDASEISAQMSRLFHIEIKDLYTCFRNIRFRKNNLLRGLDELRSKLEAYISG